MNDAPTATPLPLQTTPEDTPLAIVLTGADIDHDALTLKLATTPTRGAVLLADGSAFPAEGVPVAAAGCELRYHPASDYHGADEFTFFVVDSSGAESAPVRVPIAVTPVNDAPTAFPAAYSINERQTLPLVLAGADVDGDTLSCVVGEIPSAGTLAFANGAPLAAGAVFPLSTPLLYTPPANTDTVAGFTFTVSDGIATSAPATISIEVRNVPDAPVADGQTLTLPEDTPLPITLHGVDPDGDALTYEVIIPPAHGMLAGGAPTLVYTPDADFAGTDTFTFVARDASQESAPAVVLIVVTPVNDTPRAAGQSLSTPEDTNLALTLVGTDADGDALVYAITTPPAHGTLSGDAPALTYTPANDYHGSDTFAFTVADSSGATSAPAAIVIAVSPRNDPPTASPQSLATTEDTPLALTLSGSDRDGDVLSYVVVVQPEHGTLAGGAPALVYTPRADYHGSDSFAFVARDAEADSAPALVAIVVNSENDAPTTGDHTLSLVEDQPGALTLQATDPDGDALTFSLGQPATGNVATAWNALALDAVRLASRPVAQGGAGAAPPEISRALAIAQLSVFEAVNAVDRVYAPYDSAYLAVTGPVSLEVAAARAAHDALSALFPASAPLFDSRLAQDLAAEADPQKRANGAALGAAAAARMLALRAADGAFASSSYVPRPPGAVGHWQPADVSLWGTPNGGALRPEWGSVTPFVLASSAQFAPPAPPAVGSPEYAAAYSEVKTLGTSTSPVRSADQTQIAYYWADGPGTYSPPGHWNAIAARVAARSDLSLVATARLLALVNMANADAAIACWQSKFTHDYWRPVTAVRFADDGNPLTEADPVWSPLLGTPQFPSYPSGHSTFSSASATVLAGILGDAIRITVPSEDSRAAPRVVNSLAAAALEAGRSRVLAGIHYEFDNIAGRDLGRSIGQYVLAHALLPVAPAPAPVILRGEASLAGAALAYTPPADYHGSDVVPFSVTDGQASASARVLIDIASVNDLPVASSQAVVLLEDASAQVQLSATDADGDALAFAVTSQPAHGTLSGQPPALVYTPAANYSGTDSFTFTASDAVAASAPTQIQLTVLAVNDAPVTTPSSVMTPHYQAVLVSIAGSDPDADTLSFALASAPLHGALTLADGSPLPASGRLPSTLRYQPRYAFWGQDNFTFTASDGALVSAPASVAVTVTPPSVAVEPIVSLAPIVPVPLPNTAFALRATALDADGSVARVEFYQGSTLLGALTREEPGEPGVYSFLLPAGRPPGTYSFTAKVFDDQGLSAVSTPLALTLANDPRARTYTTTADFTEGEIRTLKSENDQLTTSFFPSAYDFVWVVNSSKGTVVRLDSETARVVGEYRASAGTGSAFPSRIAIDSRGNAFVANRQTGEIVKIGLGLDNGHWVDRDGDRNLDTSAGLNDVRPWPAGGQPVDEQILFSIQTGVAGLDHIAVDADDNLWVGPYSGAWKLYDGATGSLIRTEAGVPGLGGRGGFVDAGGIQVSAGPRFLRWDTAQSLASGASSAFAENVRRNAWGTAKGLDGSYWVTEDWSGTLDKYSSAGVKLGTFYHGEPWAQGVTIGQDGHIWVAHSHCGYTVGHLLPDGTWLGNVLVANHGPTEVSVDRKGRVWVVSTTGVVERINPLGGPLGKDGVTPLGEVDVRSPNLGGTLWTFGNFVGNRSGLFLQDGQWRFAYDGQIAGSAWGPVQWNAFLYNDAFVRVEVSLSDDGATYGPWQTLTLASPVPAGAGRYLRGRVTLAPAATGESPVLYDLTVGTQGYAAPVPPRYWRVSAGDDIDANWPDTIQLKGAFGRSDHEFPVRPTYRWSLVSFTPLPAGTTGTAPSGGVPTFSDPSNPRSTVTFNGVGDYVLRLTATLDGVVSTDDVRLHVTPFNKTPYVSAGDTVYLRDTVDSVTLSGTARDDGLPLPSRLTLQWEKLFGPGTVTFTTPAAAVTDAKFSAPGIYVLRLTGNDGEFSHSSTVTAWVGLVCRPVAPEGIVAWWQANADGADHVGGNQAFAENGAGYVDGRVGPAFNFDGLNDRVLVFGNPALDVGATSSLGSGLGIEFWVRPAESREATILQFGRNSTTSGFTIRQSGQNLVVNYRETSGLNHEATVVSALPLNTWTHLAVSYDRVSGRATILRNGVFSGSWTYGVVALDTRNDLRIGGNWADAAPFKGQIDELSIHDRALSVADAYTIYSAGDAGKRPPTSNVGPVLRAGPAGGYVLRGAARTLTLSGQVTDDGLPSGFGLTQRWTVLNAPTLSTAPLVQATATLSNPAAPDSAVVFSHPGLYTLRLEAEDGGACSRETVDVRVGMGAAAELPAGLVGWWPGNHENREFVRGRSEVGADVAYGPGKVGGAYAFDGASRYVFVPATPGQTDLGAFADGFTIELWANHTSGNNTGNLLLEWCDGQSVRLLLRNEPNNNAVRFYISNALNWTMPRLDGNWAHVAFSYDRRANYIRLYRNGVFLSGASVSPNAFAGLTTGDLYVGGAPFSTDASTRYKGGIDELSFYSRPLSYGEIAAIYASGDRGKCGVPSNQAPVVSAGPDLALPNPGRVLLAGSVTDDGLPGGSPDLTWTQLSGPVSAALENPGAAQTGATSSQPGLYVFQLSASDGVLARSDVVQVRVAASSVAEASSALVAWWPANGENREIVRDRAESGVNVAYVPGRVGLAYSFDGSNRHISVPAVPGQTDIGAFADGFAIEFWANSTATNVQVRRLVEWAEGQTVRLIISNEPFASALRFSIVGGANWYLPVLGSAWTHVVISYDRKAGLLSLYRDGLLIKTEAVAVNAFASATGGDLHFGGAPFSTDVNSRYQGGLDELAFYARPLTYAEVDSLYDAGAEGKLEPSGNLPPTVNAGAWKTLPTVGSSTNLAGVVTDDGLPAGMLDVSWTQVFGPTTAAITDVTAAQTAVTFPAAGVYGFKLRASDGLLSRSDVTEVRVATSVSSEIPSGLVAWWPGDHLNRELVRGRNEDGMNLAFIEGRVGGAYAFNATNRFVRIPEQPGQTDLGGMAKGFTLEMWLKPDGTDVNFRRILGWAGGATERAALMQRSGELYLDSKNGSWRVDIPQGVWTHVAYAYDRAEGTMMSYRDGALVAKVAVSASTASSIAANFRGELYFGGLPFRPSVEWAKESLDELSFYDHALAPGEIVALYAAGAHGKQPPGANQPPIVNAGSDQVLVDAGALAALRGQITDDGLPSGFLSAKWTQVFGPAAAVIASDSNADTGVEFSGPGIYGFKLSATDGLLTRDDVTEVRVATAGSAEIPAGLVAWWPGNQENRELVRDRLEMPSRIGYRAGKVGAAYDFTNDGLRQVIVPKTIGQTDIGSFADGFTLEFWISNDLTSDGTLKRVVSWVEGADPNRVRIELRLGVIRLQTLSTSWDMDGVGAAWTHVAYAYDRAAGKLRGYVNGVQRFQADVSATLFAATVGDLYLGGIPLAHQTPCFKGGLDELSIYNRPLAHGEIADLCNAGALGKHPFSDNQAPLVTAGPDRGVSAAGGSTILEGQAADDGLPANRLDTTWTQLFGPASATITAASSPRTAATFPVAGVYGFKLSASDGLLVRSDLVEVRVATSLEVQQPSGLVAWWPANSSTEERMTGRLEPTVNPAYGTGRVGNAWAFDAGNRHVTVAGHPEQTNLGAFAAGFTMEFWIYDNLTDDGTFRRVFGWTNGATDQMRVESRGSSDTLRFQVQGTFWDVNRPDRQWTHYAYAYDRASARIRIYRNGVQQTDSAASGSPFLSSGELSFGGPPHLSDTSRFNGLLDEVSFYDRALAAQEIAGIYNAGAQGKRPGAPFNLAPQIRLTAPVNGATLFAGEALTLSAIAVDQEGAVASVDFYDGASLLGRGAPVAAGDFRLVLPAGLSLGGHSLTAVATDSEGLSTVSSMANVTVVYAPPSVVLLEPAPGAAVPALLPITLRASASYAGGPITKVEFFDGAAKLGEAAAPGSSHPAPGYDLLVPAGLAAGSHVLTAKATAADGATRVSAPLAITAALVAPTVTLTAPAAGAQFISDRPVTLRAEATVAAGSLERVEFYRGAVLLGAVTASEPSSPTSFVLNVPAGFPAGAHVLTARAIAALSGASTTSPPINITAAPYSGPEVVEIASPSDGARLTAPTEFTGVVARAGLSSWKIEYRLTPAAPDASDAMATWTTISTGTDAIGAPAFGASPAVPGKLGVFDPTLLLNGLYQVRLAASSADGTTVVAAPISIVVEGNMKVGAFSVAFNDLVEQTPGLPITLTRTYDSRDRRVGDFGPGWHLSLGDIRVQKNRDLGVGWWQTPQSGDGIQFYDVLPIDERIVTVAMPDGETHRFRAGAYVKNRLGDPDHRSFARIVRDGSYRFYPMGDTTSTLEPIAFDGTGEPVLADRFWIDGTGDQDLYAGEYGDWDYVPYNPSRFRLTTADGTVMLLDQTLGLLELRDRNGNRLVINHHPASAGAVIAGRVESVDSIQASADGPITRTIEIHRRTDGRVDYITDLAGRTLDYLYDPQGRLASFTDRGDSTTQFRYEKSNDPAHPLFHYLTKIVDPRGLPALRCEYDDAGRLRKQIDADGNETVFDRGIDPASGRFEKIKDRLGRETTYFYDERGNIRTKIDALGATTTYDYYPDSDRVKFEEDHYGNVKGFAYDARGNVTVEILGASRAEEPATATTGYITKTSYTSFSAPLSITDPDGRVQSFGYDPSTQQLLTHTVGQLAAGAHPEVEAATPATTTYTYHPDGTLWTVTDALGNVTTTTYDYGYSDAAYPGAVKRVTTTVVDPAGAPGSDPSNAAATTLRTTYAYHDAQEDLLATVTPRTLADGTIESAPTRHVYDAENRLRFTLFPDGRISETRYTSFGQTDKTLEWPVGTDLAVLIAAGPSGPTAGARVTSFVYDARGNLERTTLPDGTTTATGYDLEGRPVWRQDARGYRTFTVYDEVGRPRFSIQPDADDGTFDDAPSSAADARLANNPRTETIYDLVGRVRFQIDEEGATTEFTYEDNCGCAMRRKEMIQHHPAGNLVTSYTYYPSGQVRSVTDPRQNTTGTRYDSHGRPVRTLLPATDEHPATGTSTIYNLLGQRVAVTDQEGKLARYRHDALGRLVEVRQYLDQSLAASDSNFSLPPSALGIVSTRYAYDEAGNQTAQTDARDHITRYEHDALGRRLKRTLPATVGVARFESLRYDNWGDLWQRDDFAGRTTTFGYDELHRLTSKQADPSHPSLVYSHAIARVEYDYDDNGAREAARTYNATGSLLYVESTPRDERGRVDYKDTGDGATLLDYDYYANGLLKDIVSSTAGGVNLGYRYDELNRLAYVDDASRGLPVRTTSYAYNGNGSLETFTYANGLRHAYRYDSLNRLRHLDVGAAAPGGPGLASVLQSYDYRLRLGGHRREVVETGAIAARTVNHTYDELYRLTGETISGSGTGVSPVGAVGYTLDKVGNREARSSTLAPVSTVSGVSFNARDQLSTDSYDANGNTLSGALGGTGVLPVNPSPASPDVYDFEDRLIVRTRADLSKVYLAYDADGIRIGKTIHGASAQVVSATNYLVCTNNLTGYAQVMEERKTDAGGTTFKAYVYGHDLLSVDRSGTGVPPVGAVETRFFLYDGGGSVRALADESGAITDRYAYDAFGVLLAHQGASDSVYLYRGEQYDADLGLTYLRARFYNQDSGRFWNQDTYEGSNSDPASLNKYNYGSNNPVIFSDPSGHLSLVEVGVSVAVTGILYSIAQPHVESAVGHAFSALGFTPNSMVSISSLGRYKEAADLLADFSINPEDLPNLFVSAAQYLATESLTGAVISGPSNYIVRAFSKIHGAKLAASFNRGNFDFTHELGVGEEAARRHLRRANGGANGGQIHHVIPWELRNHPLVQKAARGGFNINGVNNGIRLPLTQHLGSHPKYSMAVLTKLESLNALMPNATPFEAHVMIQDYVDQLGAGLVHSWSKLR